MTKCSCGKAADVKEKGLYLCAACWLKLNPNWRYKL